MSTSGILCMQCGTRIATLNKSGIIRIMPGVIVTRVFALYAMYRCPCGHERKVRHPQQHAA